MWDAISVIGSAAASAVGTAAGDEAYKYAKELLNSMNGKTDDEADNDLEKNYKRLIKQAKKLYARRDDILAQAKTKLVTQVCEAWIFRVTKSEEEVQDLETKYKKEKGKKTTWTQRLIGSRDSRIDLSKSMAEKCEKLHNLCLEGKTEIGRVIEKLPDRVIIMHGPKIEDKPFLDSTVEEIQGHLRDKNVKRIGLWGIAGIGKTTIMQSLNNNENTAKLFDIVIWVTVSRDWNLEKLQHKIADRLKLNMEGITDPNEIAQQICRELKSKRCLLLLDEVWEVLDLPFIGMFESEKDSKVVLATRYYFLCCDMETDLKINVQRMSKVDAWKMFKVKVGRNVNLPGIETIAKLVVSECAGVPLLIDKLASIFRRKDDFHLWSDGLRSLRRMRSIKVQGICEMIEFLKFCYEDLDDEVKKVCFLYVAIYPEDYEIHIDYLLECWSAEGFIHDASEFRVARDKGHSILEELISVSLLEKSAKMNHVRMNKVIRNMALDISYYRSCNFKIWVKPGEQLREAPNEEEWKQANRISSMVNKLSIIKTEGIDELINFSRSSIGQKRERVVQKEVTEKASSTLVLQEPQAASPMVSLNEITHRQKKHKSGDKGKDKVGASVWEDAATALGRVRNIVTPNDLKELSRVPSHEIVNSHIHKLVQVLGETIHLTTEYLTSEEKVVMVDSKVEALEAESSKLRKDLKNAMEEGNIVKEKVKVLTEELRVEKLLTVQKDEQLQSANQWIKSEVANAVQAFQVTKEYNSVLFSWHFKGFELLRRYLTKHNPGVDLEGLDFEAIAKEMEVDEAAEATATAVAEGNVPEAEDDASGPMVRDNAPAV